MNEETAKALEGSIRKWGNIVKRLEAGKAAEDQGTYDCPLCEIFHSGMNEGVDPETCCNGCPVWVKTGRRGCVGSPYDKWLECETLETAQAMLDFLIDLGEQPCT